MAHSWVAVPHVLKQRYAARQIYSAEYEQARRAIT